MSALHDIVKKGSTDRSVTVRIIDSGDGTPENGVVFNTSGIDLWYRREGAAKVSITEATLAALTTAHTDGGFLLISDGEYRLDLPDAAFATGANHVEFGGTVTGMIVIGGRVRLVDYDPEDTVRLGLTAVPNVAQGNAGALVTSGTGTAQLSVAAGLVTLATSQPGVTIPTVTTLTNAPSDSSGTTTLLSRLSSARAGFLDVLDLSSEVLRDHIWSIALADLTNPNNAGGVLTILKTAIELDGFVWRFTTNALENAPTGSGSAPEVIAEAVWDFALASAVASGSFGQLLNRLEDLIEDDGGTYRFTANALEEAPAGGGGGDAPTVEEIVAALLADTSIEDGKSLRGILQAMLAVLAGVTGAPGVQRTFRNPANTIDRVTTTTPGDGSRTVVTLNVS